MKYKSLIVSMILLLLIPACRKKEDDKIAEPPDGCINLSELLTKSDYHLPFALANDDKNVGSAVLNNEPTDFSYGGFIEFRDNGFYELVLIYKDPQQENDTILFTTITEEREESEWGIRAWVPAIYETGTLGQENIEIYYPHRFTDFINVPLIFYVKESGTVKPVYCEGINLDSGDSFNIKRGVGSVNMAASSITNRVDFIVGGKRISATLARTPETKIELKGIINSDVEIPANSLVRIPQNLDITSTGSLTVHEGTLILVDEAVDINVSGPVVFSGTAGNPVTVTCSRSDKYWGGFITRTTGGTIEAYYSIFCQSGYHDTEGYYWGHSGRQALFYTENSSLIMDHCFITDHIGQVFYPLNATLTLDNILVQRAQTGGQVNFSDLTLRNSVFTDFPDDSYDYADRDNDALYLTGTDAEIDNTVFMFAKDDGLDSGDPEGGEITLTNCRFEACFHEGAALSSGGTVVKNHFFRDCVFTNCGQGLELGFSSPNHSVTAENCRFLNNGIGIRYGDNYEWSDVNGKMLIKNSLSLFNGKDVWNMVRMTWSPRLNNLSFENTLVSQFCPQYPGLPVKEE
jgi:hypothetical protein